MRRWSRSPSAPVSVFASRGLLTFLTSLFGVDALALTVCTMMGLALGVDYSLLMVSRFREELAKGADPIDAAWATRRTAGRTTVFAGSTLVLSMVVALFVVPGALLAVARSNAGTGGGADRTGCHSWSVRPPSPCSGPTSIAGGSGAAPNGERSLLMTLVFGGPCGARRRSPRLIGAVVLVLAAPAIALKTGPFEHHPASPRRPRPPAMRN